MVGLGAHLQQQHWLNTVRGVLRVNDSAHVLALAKKHSKGARAATPGSIVIHSATTVLYCNTEKAYSNVAHAEAFASRSAHSHSLMLSDATADHGRSL